MAGVTKKEGRIPPLLPQKSSSSSLSPSPSFSSLLLLLPPSPSMVSPSPTCSSRRLGRSRAGRHRVVGTPDILSHSDRVGIGRVGEVAASTQATASPRPRSPPSFPSPPLPPSPRSTHLTLSPRPFFPTRVVVVAAEHHYRLAQAVVIARRRCHHPFPSSPLLPSLPAAVPLPLSRAAAWDTAER